MPTMKSEKMDMSWKDEVAGDSKLQKLVSNISNL